MVKTVYSNDISDLETIDPSTILLVEDLEPFISEKTKSSFPSLSMDIYKWCVKKKCKYKKVNYLSIKDEQFSWAMMFKDKESCDTFREHWVNSVVYMPKGFGQYEFADPNNWDWYWRQVMSKEAIAWLTDNKIRTTKRDPHWLRFSTPEKAMAFKLAWM